jgi:hypothetical protein
MTTALRLPRRALAYLGALILAVSLLIVADTRPAHASVYSCRDGYFCIWTDANSGGTMLYWHPAQINGGIRIAPAYWGRASSAYNRTGYWVRLYAASNCPFYTTDYHDVQQTEYIANFAQWRMDGGQVMNDRVRSLTLLNGAQQPC